MAASNAQKAQVIVRVLVPDLAAKLDAVRLCVLEGLELQGHTILDAADRANALQTVLTNYKGLAAALKQAGAGLPSDPATWEPTQAQLDALSGMPA